MKDIGIMKIPEGEMILSKWGTIIWNGLNFIARVGTVFTIKMRHGCLKHDMHQSLERHSGRILDGVIDQLFATSVARVQAYWKNVIYYSGSQSQTNQPITTLK